MAEVRNAGHAIRMAMAMCIVVVRWKQDGVEYTGSYNDLIRVAKDKEDECLENQVYDIYSTCFNSKLVTRTHAILASTPPQPEIPPTLFSSILMGR